MADKNTQTEAQKLEAKAAEDRQKQLDAEEAARRAKLSDEERKAEDARVAANETEAKAVQARGEADASSSEGETVADEVKSVSSKVGDLGIGDHYVQTFANTPANPAPAPRLSGEPTVRMEITDSDHPDPLNPKVTYVHPDMEGDYLRAGWRRPVA